MTNNIDNLLAELGAQLTAKSREALAALSATPEARAIIGRQDDALVHERTGWIKELAAVPKKHATALLKAGDARVAAEQRLLAAHKAIADARDALVIATSHSLGIETGQANEVGRLEQLLVETADSRFAKVVDHCEELIGATGNVSWSISWQEGHTWSGSPLLKFDSNVEQVAAMRHEIRRIQSDARGLLMAAISYADATERLQAMLLDLHAQVQTFGLAILTISESGALVRESSRNARQLADDAIAAAGVPGNQRVVSA